MQSSSEDDDDDFVRVRGNSRRGRHNNRNVPSASARLGNVEASSSSDEERLGRRLPRPQYQTVDDNNDEEQEGVSHTRRRHTTKEEALYGVFYESSDNEKERGGNRRRGGGGGRGNPSRHTSSKKSSSAPPRFVAGCTLDPASVVGDDDDKNVSKARDNHVALPQKDDNHIPEDADDDDDTPAIQKADTKQKDDDDEAMQDTARQRDEANQRFLSLLEAGRKKGARKKPLPPPPVIEEEEERMPRGLGAVQQENGGGRAGLGFASTATAHGDHALGGLGYGSRRPQGLGLGASAGIPPPGESDSAADNFMGGLGFGAGRRQGLGLGAASTRQAQNNNKKPQVGTWVKHDKGVGLKLLQRMGWKGSGGLGARADKTGIAKPVEVKVRPANLGLGFGSFKEASTLTANRQIDAQLRGQGFVEETTTKKATAKPTKVIGSAMSKSRPSTLPSVDQLLQQQSWRRGQKRKRATNNIVPFTDLLQEQEAKKTTTIIDMRGPTNTKDEDEEGNSTIPLAQEALHNVSLLLNTYENKLHNQAQLVQSTRSQLASLESDVTSVKAKGIQSQDRLDKLERMLHVMDHVQNLTQDELEQTQVLVQDLSRSFTAQDRESLQFDSVLVPTLLGHVLQHSLERWDPLREPTAPLLQTVMATAASSRTLQASLLQQHLLPRISRVLQGTTLQDAHQTEAAVSLVEHLIQVTSPYEEPTTITTNKTQGASNVSSSSVFAIEEETAAAVAPTTPKMAKLIRNELVNKIVHDKLSAVLAHWKPNLTDRLDTWILPWAVHMEASLLSTLVSQARRKLTTALSSTTRSPALFCQKAMTILTPWVGVFKPSKLHDLVSQVVLPRLTAHLASVDLLQDPVEWTEAVQLALDMHQAGLVADREWLSSLEGGVLLPWAQSMHRYLHNMSSTTNPPESPQALVEAYIRCRRLLLSGESSCHKVIRQDAMICRYFYGVLCMLQAAYRQDDEKNGKATKLADLEPPKTTYRAVLARRTVQAKQEAADDMTRLLDHDETAETRVRLNRQEGHNHVPATFREVVEAYARERDISFVPKQGSNASKDGKPIFVLRKNHDSSAHGAGGGDPTVQVYLDANVVYWWNKPVTEWQPISLRQLVERASQ